MAQTLVGTRIRDRRIALGIKQAALARDSGISPSYLNLIEHNRRKIAGGILLNIAQSLNITVEVLNDGENVELLQGLQTAAALEASPVEIDRLEEFAGRFPGWSGLAASLSRKNLSLRHELDSLNDRLAHDPFLVESLHEILSNVTAIRSLSSILAQNDDIARDQQKRFHQNLFVESRRLTETSQTLATYFDEPDHEEETLSTPLDEFEAFLSDHSFHFEPLEKDGDDDVSDIVISTPRLASDASKSMAGDFLTAYRDRAQKMPLAGFLACAGDLDFEPEPLAAKFRVSLHDVFLRLACLPENPVRPEFGLVSCDLAGAIIFRKPLPGFPLPRYGAACPLWPLYQSLTQPHRPLMARLETPGNQSFASFAQALPASRQTAGGPITLNASMLFRSSDSSNRDGFFGNTGPSNPVGLSCRICPRKDCIARREPSILTARI